LSEQFLQRSLFEAKIRKNCNWGLAMLIVSPFSLFLCLVILTILRHPNVICMSFLLAINRETGVGGVDWTITGYCRQNAGKSKKWTGREWHYRLVNSGVARGGARAPGGTSLTKK